MTEMQFRQVGLGVCIVLMTELLLRILNQSHKTVVDKHDYYWSYVINSTILAEDVCRRPIAVCPANGITCHCCTYQRRRNANRSHATTNLLVTLILLTHFWKRCQARASKWSSVIYSQLFQVPLWTCCACVAPFFYVTQAEYELLFKYELLYSGEGRQFISESISKNRLIHQTHDDVLRLQMELIVIENTIASMHTRLQSQNLTNKDMIDRYVKIHEQLVRTSVPYTQNMEPDKISADRVSAPYTINMKRDMT